MKNFNKYEQFLVDEYNSENHTVEERIAFIEGINRTINLLNKVNIQDIIRFIPILVFIIKLKVLMSINKYVTKLKINLLKLK